MTDRRKFQVSVSAGYPVHATVATIRLDPTLILNQFEGRRGKARPIGILFGDHDEPTISMGPVFLEEERLHGFSMSIDDAERLALRLLRTVVDARTRRKERP